MEIIGKFTSEEENKPNPLLIYSRLINKMPIFVVVDSDQHLGIERMSMRRE